MKSLRPLAFWALSGTIVVLIVVLSILARLISGQLEELRTAPNDSMQWSLLQVGSEFNRLKSAYETYVVLGNDAGLDELRLRSDIFFSRIKIIQDSHAFAGYRAMPHFADGQRQLSRFAESLTQLVDSGDLARIRADDRLRRDFEALAPIVSDFVTSSVQLEAAASDARRANLYRLLVYGIAAIIFLIATFLFALTFVARQHRELRARQHEVVQSRDIFQATVSSSLDGVIIIDPAGRIVEFNSSAERIFGFERGSVVGRPLADVIVPERYRAAHSAGMARYMATKRSSIIGKRIEIEAQKADGSEIQVELSINVSGIGKKLLFIAYVRDISQRRADEETLRLAKHRAEEASKVKAQFLAAMSHEIRTPLTGILGALDLLRASELTDGQRKSIGTAIRSGEALLSVISDVIDMSRLEAGKLELVYTRFDFRDLIGDVLEIVGNLARQRGNEISWKYDPAAPGILIGDPSKIRQVLLNLMTNAAKFTFEGKIDLEVSLLALDRDSARLEVSVRDSGKGIPEKDQAKLFQEFSQVEQGYARRAEGSGLGLAISKRLVDMMGGDIGVESRPGEGSRFWFRLNLEVASSGRAMADKGLQEPIEDHELESKRILLVDDNETIRSVVGEMLTSRGHRVTVAESGLEAIERARSDGFDVVLMDISMPGMDGTEAIRIIRSLPGEAGRVPIVALTAHALSDDRDRCLAAGASSFLTKPVRLPLLLAALREVSPGQQPQPEPGIGAAPDSELPLIDRAELVTLLESVSPAAFRRVMDHFSSELERQQAALASGSWENSPGQLKQIAHSLAGSSSTIGARRLAFLAGKLDLAAASGTPQELLASVEELVDTIRQSRVELKNARLEFDRPVAAGTGFSG